MSMFSSEKSTNNSVFYFAYLLSSNFKNAMTCKNNRCSILFSIGFKKPQMFGNGN